MRVRVPLVVAAVLAGAVLAGCGGEDPTAVRLEAASDSGSDSSSASSSGSASASTAEESQVSQGVQGYRPVSDVEEHADIGEDAESARELMAPAVEGGTVDWPAVAAVIREGGASMKSDGSVRTLATLVEGSAAVGLIDDALEGDGARDDVSDAVRRQRVDKGLTVILAEKVLDELAAAREKIVDGDLEPETGAAHNVDEAWAFYEAEGQGPRLTADKRGADFSTDLNTPVLLGLNAAQHAALTGDLSAFDLSVTATEQALARIFYLATFKYLDTDGDEVIRAEGESFYLGIAEAVREADSSADEAIRAAFASGDTEGGRDALNDDTIREVLGIDEAEVQ